MADPIGPGTHQQKATKRRFPVTSGLVAGDTKQEGRKPFLVARKSVVKPRFRFGMR